MNHILHHFTANCQKQAKSTAVEYFKNNTLYSLNWSQVHDRIEQYYNVLKVLEVEAGDKVAIYSNTCKEWGFLDLAILSNRAVTVPVYHSSHISEVEFILEDSSPKVLFVQNESLYKKIKDSHIFEKIQQVILIEEFQCNDERIQFLKQLVDVPETQESLATHYDHIQLSDLATIIYTSGTSGQPKGVCLSHQQIMSSVSEVFPILGVTASDKSLLFLPLSHILGRMEFWGHCFCGYSVAYAESVEKIKRNIGAAKPTVIVGVPRIFEKIYFGVLAQVEISKLKQFIFNQALTIGRKNAQLRRAKKSPSLLQAMQSQMAHRLVFSSIHQRLGGHLRFAVSGGAPLDASIAEFFAACGIPILEGYGLTETTGPIAVNTLFNHKSGYVGQPLGEVELRLAEDNEILVKSKKVMTGYFNNEEATKKVMTKDGFFHTGDIGEIDKDGFLKITDRKKDLIKTAGGKFVAPQKLQNLFSTDPLISQVHIHGDKKKFIVALITLETDELQRLRKENNWHEKDSARLSQLDDIKKRVRQSVASINGQVASFETIKHFHIMEKNFTIEDGLLTPSLKMKRKKIDETHQSLIDSLYQ